ncbi:MAG: glycosyltransferase family 4 protein [Candidatus Rokubacteria bacterium]|nr:glycosyltransferase family 4 protein [Candidatus Rokubacteria bacterium]MBI3825282.1 glycosyltransferase family 4 protein [Candidatus Rokubacteria bacterium]
MPPRRSIAVNAAIVGARPTGLGHYALHAIAALDALGERLTVYTPRPDLVRAPGATVRALTDAVTPERGAAGHLARLIWVQSGLRMRVRRDRPDVLLNLMPEGLLWPAVPQVTTVYDLLPLWFPSEYPRQQYYFRHYVPAVLRHSRAVLVISESTRRDVQRFYGVPAAKVHVVLAGYDAGAYNLDGGDAHPSSEPYALYVGNVMPHKNLLRLVEAFAAAVPQGPGRLVVRGWGRPRHVAALRRRIDALGIAARVDWQPYAPADELPRLYRGARMFLLPSLYEGFGLPVLEAMACGAPVITSSRSSLPEVAGDAALLVDPEDTGALAQAMTRLFADDGLAKDLRERGLARVGLFSWEKTGRAMRAAVDAALAAG